MGFHGDHGALAVHFFKSSLEVVGQALGVVVGHFKEHSGFFGLELLGGKVNRYRRLEGVKKCAAEHPGASVGGVGVGGPGSDQRHFFVIGHATGGDGLTRRLRANDSVNLVALDELEGDVDCGFRLGFVIFIDEFKRIEFVAHFEAALGVDFFFQHFGREF